VNPDMMTPPLSPDDFAARCGVSRETLARFQTYADLLLRWQKAINLVGASTLPDLWRRHFEDSAQLFSLLPPTARVLVDLGSGAGFPGLVLALMGVPEVHLVESDRRKATFLREAARATGTAVTVHADRIESVPPFPADVVTSRACAPLQDLLKLSLPFRKAGTLGLFLKGKMVNRELTRANEVWDIESTIRPSGTDPEGSILLVQEWARAENGRPAD